MMRRESLGVYDVDLFIIHKSRFKFEESIKNLDKEEYFQFWQIKRSTP